jgi:hypothetical protein
MSHSTIYVTQNQLLLTNLIKFYGDNDNFYLKQILPIINGTSNISIRVIDWFVTNYSKKNYVNYMVNDRRFKVYDDYKLKLKAYSKKRFDPFCRWDRINIPYDENVSIQTTIGQLNFFKWAIENNILNYIENNDILIMNDMNNRNTSSKNKKLNKNGMKNKTRKKREELSISATRNIKKEHINITVSFD